MGSNLALYTIFFGHEKTQMAGNCMVLLWADSEAGIGPARVRVNVNAAPLYSS